MDDKLPSVVCVDPSVYHEALTRGATYAVLARADGKLRTRDDRGKVRWYPLSCFATDPGELVSLVAIEFAADDPAATAGVAREVTVELSTGERRWCYFITPAMLERLSEQVLGAERLLATGAAHMLIVTSVSNATIEGALRYLESQNRLMECTRALTSAAPD